MFFLPIHTPLIIFAIMDINLDFDIIGAISLIVGALWFGWVHILKPRNELINKALDGHKLIETISKDITNIKAELYPNHGSSFRDTADRIERFLIKVSQKQHVFLLEHQDGYFETDEDGSCIFVNRAYCHMVERTESECLGTGWVHNIHPDDRQKVTAEWMDCVSGMRDFRMKYRFITSNGSVVSVYGQGSPMIDKHRGKLIGYFGTVKRDLEI